LAEAEALSANSFAFFFSSGSLKISPTAWPKVAKKRGKTLDGFLFVFLMFFRHMFIPPITRNFRFEIITDFNA
jgi:hypothetical protein